MLDNAPNVPGATLPDPHPRAGGLRVSSERHPEGPTTNEASPCRQDPPGPAARRGCPSVPLAQAGGVGFRGTLRREGWLSPSSVPGGTRTGVASGQWHGCPRRSMQCLSGQGARVHRPGAVGTRRGRAGQWADARPGGHRAQAGSGLGRERYDLETSTCVMWAVSGGNEPAGPGAGCTLSPGESQGDVPRRRPQRRWGQPGPDAPAPLRSRGRFRAVSQDRAGRKGARFRQR